MVPGFHYSDDADLHKFGRQLQVSMAPSAYASKEGSVKKMVPFLICKRLAGVTQVIVGQFLQLILESSRRKTEFIL